MVMYFSQILLDKKGPLSRIWLAAHWERKLKRAHIFQIDIESSVQGIMSPKFILDLKTIGHLLLGVSKVYSRKAKYLLSECNDIFIKINMAFRPGVIDLPEGQKEASLRAITMPEVFYSFEDKGDLMIDLTALNTSQPEAITLKENYGNMTLMGDELDAIMLEDLENEQEFMDIDDGFTNNGLLGNMGNDLLQINEDDCIQAQENIDYIERIEEPFNDVDELEQIAPVNMEIVPENIEPPDEHLAEEPMDFMENAANEPDHQENHLPNNKLNHSRKKDVFLLEPYKAPGKRKVTRKRKLIVDTKTSMKRDEIKVQIHNIQDIVTTSDLAPPSKRLMHLKATGGAEKLLSLSGCKLLSNSLLTLFQCHLRIHRMRPAEECKFSESEESNSHSSSETAEVEEQNAENVQCAENVIEEIATTPPNVPSETTLHLHLSDSTEVTYLAENEQPTMQLENLNAIEGQQEELIEEEAVVITDLPNEINSSIHDGNVSDDTNLNQENRKSNPEKVVHDEEDFQDRVSSMLNTLQQLLMFYNIVPFSSFAKRHRKHQVARNFYTILMLKKLQAVELEQKMSYSEINIFQGENFNLACSHFPIKSVLNIEHNATP